MNGRDGNRGRRRPFRRDRRQDERPNQGGGQDSQGNQNDNRQNRGEPWKNGRYQGKNQERRGDGRNERRNSGYDKKGMPYDRPRWTAPERNTDPIPVPDCAYCGKPITDLHSAITDKKTGTPVHFDCVINELGKSESLEEGDVISYIGGGRFGVLRFGESRDDKKFTIKKIIEWEDKEHKSEWRNDIADHYSVT